MEGILIPQEVFVGDTAEFIYPFPHLLKSEKELLLNRNFQIEKIEQNEDMTVTAISVMEQDNKILLSIRFIPWASGKIKFPPLKNAGITAKLPDVCIASILEKTDTHTVQPPRPPVIIPGTVYILYEIIFALGLLLFIMYESVKFIKKNFFTKSFLTLQKKEYRYFKKTLRRLERQVNNRKVKTYEDRTIWIKKFENAFKRYFFKIALYCKNCETLLYEAATYTEVTEAVKEQNIFTEETIQRIEKVFDALQTIRFSGIDLSLSGFLDAQLFFIKESYTLLKMCCSEIYTTEEAKNKTECSKHSLCTENTQ